MSSLAAATLPPRGPMATEIQLNNYISQMPAIYKDILAIFPEAEPFRKSGYGLAFQTITILLARNEKPYSFEDVRLASTKLEGEGIVEIKNEIFVHPTEIGEQLISMITKRPLASAQKIPELPARTW